MMLMQVIQRRKIGNHVSAMERPIMLNFFFKRHTELSKPKKKSSKEKQVALTTYSIQPTISISSFLEWILDSSASNHMNGNDSSVTSYDKENNLS